MLPWKCNSSLTGHLSGHIFCLLVKLTRPELSIIRMLSERSVVIDFEGFVYKKVPLVLKN